MNIARRREPTWQDRESIMGILIGLLIIAIFVAVGAKGLGYSGTIWFFAVVCCPPFALGLLASLPDRKLEQRRFNMLRGLHNELDAAAAAAGPREEQINDGLTVRE
jgi:hypothetical protein